LFDHQSADDRAVIDAGGAARFEVAAQTVDVPPWPAGMAMLLPGRHNELNASLAAAACSCAGVDIRDAFTQLTNFRGLPHRLQLVGEHEDVRYFNDSKATTPEAMDLALQAFAPGVVHLIAGGYDKGVDLKPFIGWAANHCRAIYTIGATGDDIADVADAGDATVVRCGTLDEAMHQTMTRIHRGDVVLLSPGCASWDQFDNFEQRGNAFIEAVLRFTGEGAPPPARSPSP